MRNAFIMVILALFLVGCSSTPKVKSINVVTTPAEKPLNKTDTTELLQMAKMGDNNPKVINELRTRFKGTKKQIDRKIRKAIKRLGKS